MSTINQKFLDLQGLSNIANKVEERLKKVPTMPANPSNGDTVLYTGSTGSYVNGCVYTYDGTQSAWILKGLVPTVEGTAIVFNL